MSGLKRCPFCGGEARWATEHKHWIECGACGVESIYSENSEDCIKAWNTRKPVERILERLEKRRIIYETNVKPIFPKGDIVSKELEKAIEIIKEEVE